MRRAGQIVLLPLPFTNLSGRKLRPVLLLRRTHSRFDDWLACMISSQIRQAEPGLDEILDPSDKDFTATGLKAPSVVRLARLAVIEGGAMVGALGEIPGDRLQALRVRLAQWLIDSKEQ